MKPFCFLVPLLIFSYLSAAEFLEDPAAVDGLVDVSMYQPDVIIVIDGHYFKPVLLYHMDDCPCQENN